jgi:hypothetical protein
MRLSKDQKETIKLLTTITKACDDWKAYAYRIREREFAVTDGVRLMTLDLSGVVPDHVDCFDPQWALFSDHPWHCSMSEERVRANTAEISKAIPSGELYRSSLCEPFFAPDCWGELGKIKRQIKAYLEIPDFSIKKFWSDKLLSKLSSCGKYPLSHPISFKLALDKVHSPDYYSIAVDLRLLSPMAGAIVTIYPYVGKDESTADEYKLNPIFIRFKLYRGRGRSGSMVIMPMRDGR